MLLILFNIVWLFSFGSSYRLREFYLVIFKPLIEKQEFLECKVIAQLRGRTRLHTAILHIWPDLAFKNKNKRKGMRTWWNSKIVSNKRQLQNTGARKQNKGRATTFGTERINILIPNKCTTESSNCVYRFTNADRIMYKHDKTRKCRNVMCRCTALLDTAAAT